MIKNQNIKLNDTGFLYSNNDVKNLEVFKLTKKILHLKTQKNKICLNSKCYLKKDFNKYFFGSYYDENLIDDILSFKPIFNRENAKLQDECMVQKITSQGADIDYKVCKNTLSFIDNKHKNTIKIKILN